VSATTAIETARLRGEPIAEAHNDALAALLGDPRVGATLGGVLAPDRVADLTATMVRHWARHGFGYWVWRETATGAVVGRGGLQRVHVGGRDEVEVGWTVMPDRWGEGFATELGAACVRHAFDVLGCDDVVEFPMPGNLASRRVMEKLGFAFERDIEHADLPHVLYRLRAGSQAGSPRPGTAMPDS
jgi:[ribosomal protein S5]-alanine N-acetyltransferase